MFAASHIQYKCKQLPKQHYILIFEWMCFWCIGFCFVLSRQPILWSAFSVVLLTHNMRQIDLHANCTPYLTLYTCYSFRFYRQRIENKLKKKTMINSFENIPKDTQTQIFYVFSIESFLLVLLNKWISLFLHFVSAVSIEFLQQLFHGINSQPNYSIPIDVPLLKNELNSSMEQKKLVSFAAADVKELRESAAYIFDYLLHEL